jgi:hypothetical protein
MGHDVDHSSPSSAEVKKVELYISSPYMPSWCGQRQLYLLPFLDGQSQHNMTCRPSTLRGMLNMKQTLVNIQQHQMSLLSGSTPALYPGGLTLSLLFREQVWQDFMCFFFFSSSCRCSDCVCVCVRLVWNLSFKYDNVIYLFYSAVDLRRHIACEVCDPSVSGGYDPLLNQVAVFDLQL